MKKENETKYVSLDTIVNMQNKNESLFNRIREENADIETRFKVFLDQV